MTAKNLEITPKFFKPKRITKVFAEEVRKAILNTERGKGWLFIYQTFDNKWGLEYVTTLHKTGWSRAEQNVKYKFYLPIKEEECQRSKEILESYRGDKEAQMEYVMSKIQEYTGGVWYLTNEISDKNLEVLCKYQKYLPYTLQTISVKDMGMNETKPLVQKIYKDLYKTYEKYLRGDFRHKKLAKTPKVDKVTVKGLWDDGNAYAILAKTCGALKDEGFTEEQIKQYEEEAKSGDYDNLIQVTMRWTTG